MKVTRQSVAEKLSAYLRHDLPLEGLVNWAERVMEDCEQLLRRLRYHARISVLPA